MLHKFYVLLDDEEVVDIEVDGEMDYDIVSSDRCYYCGEMGGLLDHVPALYVVYTKLMANEDLSDVELICVQACTDCNRRLGAKPLLTLPERAAYLRTRKGP